MRRANALTAHLHIICFYEVGCSVNYFVAYLGNFKHSPSYLYTLGILKVLELCSHYLPCIHVVDMLSRDFYALLFYFGIVFLSLLWLFSHFCSLWFMLIYIFLDCRVVL